MASPFQVGLAMQVCYNYLARHRLTDTFRPFLSLTRPFLFTAAGPAIDKTRLASECVKYLFYHLGEYRTFNPEAEMWSGLNKDYFL